MLCRIDDLLFVNMSIISDKDAKYMDQIYDLQEEVKELHRENIQMKHTQEQYKQLVAKLLDYIDAAPMLGSAKAYESLKTEAEKFRESKAARIRSHIGNNEVSRSVELTAAVKARLGPTANIDNRDIISAVYSHKFMTGKTDDIVEVITELIAGAVPEIDGDL